MVKATSHKVGNIRFHLMDLLFASAETAVTAQTADDAVSLTLSALQFLREVLSFTSLPLDKDDANLLLSIHRLRERNEVPTIEALSKFDEPARLTARLDRLSKLGCITLLAGSVRLNERIVIRTAG